MCRNGARRSCETEYENASSSLFDGGQLIAAIAELADERLLTLAHHRVIELHGGFVATDAQQCEIVSDKECGFRQHDEQQTARAHFAGNRHDVHAARGSPPGRTHS